VLVGILAVVLFAMVTTAGEVPLAEGPPTFLDDVEPGRATPPPVPVESIDREVVEQPDDTEASPLIEQIARLIGWGSLAVAMVVTTIVLWRTRPTFERWRRRRARDDSFVVLADVAATVDAGADAQRTALGRGTPRNAIVECWLLLEHAVADAGVARRPADTAAELTERVLADHHVDASALASLAALYREARFSDHEMDESSRSAAIDALDAVHDSLRRARSTSTAEAT